MASSRIPRPDPPGRPARSLRAVPEPGTLVIDCDECVARDTAACADCVVTFVCDRAPDHALVVDDDEARTLRLLGEAGLVPRLRHERRVS